MFSIDGEFGQVRSIQVSSISNSDFGPSVPFHFNNGGWHRCNELYRINRENGKDGHLLLFSISEGGILELGNKPRLQLPSSSVAWIPHHCKHSYYTQPGKTWEFYWLDIPDAPHIQLDKLFELQPIMQISNMDEISRVIESLLRSRNMTKHALLIESSSIIGNIYHSLLKEKLLQSKTGKQDELVYSIIREMESCCRKKWNLPDLSQQFFISIPQLIRRFKAETGKTPYAYLMMLRLQTAEAYIKYSNRSIEEISQLTGFSSTSNFIQQFRKYYGITPSKYRGRQ